MADVDQQIQESVEAGQVPSTGPEDETVDQQIDRLIKDSEARYPGRCPPDRYPVGVKTLTPTWVEPDMPDRPGPEAFCYLQGFRVKMEWRWQEDGQWKHEEATVEDGPLGVPFIAQVPFDPFIGECRASIQWAMQDSHPENRGFMALPGYDGRTYYGTLHGPTPWAECAKPQWMIDEEREKARAEQAQRDHEQAVKEREAFQEQVREENAARNAASLAAEAESKERAEEYRERQEQESAEWQAQQDRQRVLDRAEELRSGLADLSDADKAMQLNMAATSPLYADRYAEAARIVAEEWGITL